MSICSEHDNHDYPMGAAVALLKARPTFNKAMRDYLESLQDIFSDDYSRKIFLRVISKQNVVLTDSEVMSYCMIRAELSNRIKEASKIEEVFEWDKDGDFMLGTRRRRGPDNAFIVEDCARKLVKACPSLARLSNA